MIKSFALFILGLFQTFAFADLNPGGAEQGFVTTSAPTYSNNTYGRFSLNLSGALRIDGSGVVQPIISNDGAPANGSITAVDTGTSALTGANGQVFYFGTPTTNSAASFALSSIANVNIQANILGGGGTLVVEVSTDGGSFWFRPNIFQTSTQIYSNSFTAPFEGTLNVSGLTNVRVRAITSWSGTATAIIKETTNSHSVTIGDALPPGTNTIGNTGRTWTLGSGTDSVAAVQSGTWNTGRTWTLSSGTDSVAAVQSGTWTVQQGATPTAVANAWPFKLTDGTNTTAVKAASTAPVATDPAAVVVLSPNGDQATAANQTTEITALQIIDNPVGSSTGGTAGTASSMAGGIYNSTLPALTNGQQASIQLDSGGRTIVASTPLDGTKATYSATSAIAFASATAATDIFTITGSASKLVRILSFAFSAQQTSAGVENVLVIKRSAANTGGTSAAATRVPHDSADVAATATVLNYTANPSALGASVGAVRAARIFIPTTGTDTDSFVKQFDFGALPEKAIVLHGTAEVLAINLNGVTVAGGTWTCYVTWTEE